MLEAADKITQSPWKRRLGALGDKTERGLNMLLAVMLAVLVASLVYQVFGRYVLNHAPSWTEELSRFLMVYITMLGSSSLIRRQGHVAVNVLVDALPEPFRQMLLWLRDAIMLSAAGFLMWYGYSFALIGARRASPALEISMYWPILSIPISGALIALFLVLGRLDPRYPPDGAGAAAAHPEI